MGRLYIFADIANRDFGIRKFNCVIMIDVYLSVLTFYYDYCLVTKDPPHSLAPLAPPKSPQPQKKLMKDRKFSTAKKR